jgi:ATP-dependent exoDNAse (exonuclease V) alpha subunit
MFTLLTLGFQLVVCGDFFQLPPVAKGAAQAKFAFEAELWSQCVERTFNLTKVFRQKEQGRYYFACCIVASQGYC